MWTFNPILKQTLWGGERIAAYKRLDNAPHAVGESWEVSGLPGSESVVSCGPDKGLTINNLIEKYNEDLLGARNQMMNNSRFPLLIKFIDAERDLSVQVHPNDEMAVNLGHPNGKTEMWFVLKAEKDANIVAGFNRKTNPEELRVLSDTGQLQSLLRTVPTHHGDLFFIPAGRVHSLGKGNLVLEVQQALDITYRLYDYGRLDANGEPRPLQIEEAIKAVNYDDEEDFHIDYDLQRNLPISVVQSPFFTVNLLEADSPVMRNYREWDTFVIIVALRGTAHLETNTKIPYYGDTEPENCVPERREMEVREGCSVLIPAVADSLTIVPDKDFLCAEIYLK